MSSLSSGQTRTIPQEVGSRDHLSLVSAALSQEFAESLDVAIIERVAAEELSAFDDARVRDFIPILVIRSARLRLGEWASGGPGGGRMTG